MNIKHIEDLPKKDILYIIDHLDEMEITEKIDGSNLTFGFNSTGQFYTSRTSKGSKQQFFSVDQYPLSPVNNAFKAAHVALSSVLTSQPVPNTEFTVEVLLGRQPNAVVYGSNRIVFLTDVPFKIDGHTTSVVTEHVYTTDGILLRTKPIETTWTFSKVPKINDIKHINISSDLSTENIKSLLITKLLSSIRPKFRDVKVEDYEDFGIEGVVIQDPRTGIITKVIDKERFTLINQFNFAIRNEIKSTGPRFNSAKNRHLYHTFAATIGYKNTSIYDTFLSSLAEFFGIDGLNKYLTITRTLKKYQSIDNVIDNLKCPTDISVVKPFCVAAVERAIEQLEEGLDTFKSQWKSYELILNNGKTIRYSSTIYERTLTVFAEVLSEFLCLVDNLLSATTTTDIITTLYEKQVRLAFPNT